MVDAAGVGPSIVSMRATRAPYLVVIGVAAVLTACDRGSDPAARERAAASPSGSSIPALASAAPSTSRTAADVTPKTEPPREAEILSNAFANAAKAIRPSVVQLDVEMKRAQGEMAQGPQPRGPAPPPGMEDFFERFFDFGSGDGMLPPPGLERGTGSGVVFDAAGHVVTNSHVVHGASRVTIAFSDGQKYAGKVVGADPYTDVAVVRFEKKPEALTVARLGNSDELRVGQWVIAVGSPLGLTQTVTAGIVSGLGRTGGRIQLSGERVRRYIQTDALINPGNSGGPLVNLRGEVVGINSVINVGPGGSYGFAIPVNQVSEVVQTIVKEGRVRYPYMGVMISNLEEIPPEQRGEIGRNLPDKGVVVTEVTPGGPAAQAGLKPGDVISKIGGTAATSASDVIDFVSGQPIGSKVTVEYRRDGKTSTIEMKLAELPAPDSRGGPEGATIGISLQTLTEPLARSLGVDPNLRGAVIADVRPDSPAARAGLQPGDIIRDVNGKPVASAEEAVAAIKSGPKKHLLRVTNAAGTRFVTVTPE